MPSPTDRPEANSSSSSKLTLSSSQKTNHYVGLYNKPNKLPTPPIYRCSVFAPSGKKANQQAQNQRTHPDSRTSDFDPRILEFI